MKYFYQCKYRFLLAFQGSLRAYLPANKVTKPGECRELVCMLYNLGWLEPYIYTVYRRMSDEISANNTVCIPFIWYIYIYIFMVLADLIQDVPWRPLNEHLCRSNRRFGCERIEASWLLLLFLCGEWFCTVCLGFFTSARPVPVGIVTLFLYLMWGVALHCLHSFLTLSHPVPVRSGSFSSFYVGSGFALPA